jgi:hypothetical protein
VGAGTSILRDELVYDAIDDEFVGGSPSWRTGKFEATRGELVVPSMTPHR